MSETITASLTVSGGDTITAEINTLARGPAGPTGASGASTWDDITGTAASIPFEPGAAPAYAEGKVFYDSTDKSLSYYSDDVDVALNIGREMWVRVRNNSGSTISNGKVVYLSGATGQLPTIALARADSASTSRVIGVATHDIENNSNGYVTAMGEVKGLDTSAFADGDVLYLSAATAGELTTTAPTAPNRAIQVATVEHSHVSQGKLFVHPETDSVASTGIVDSTSTGRSLLTATDMAAANAVLGEIRSSAPSDVNATTQNVWVESGASVALTSGTWRVMAFYHGGNATSSVTNVRLSATANWTDTNGRRIGTQTGIAIASGPTYATGGTSSAANFGSASLVAGEIVAVVKMTGSGTLSLQFTNTAATGTATSYSGNHIIAVKVA